MPRSSRRGAIAAAGGAAPFNPVTSIPWAHAYWTSGPESIALGLADAAAVSTIPDEIATADLVQATALNKPTYRSAAAGMNNKPTWEFDGANSEAKGAFTTIAFPFTVYMVARCTDVTVNANNQYMWADNPGTDGSTHFIVSTPGTGRVWGIAGNNSTKRSLVAANTLVHAHRCEANAGTDIDCYLDETDLATGSTNIQAGGMDGFSLGARSDIAVGTQASMQLSFIGIIGRVLTAGEITNMRTWAQGFYATP